MKTRIGFGFGIGLAAMLAFAMVCSLWNLTGSALASGFDHQFKHWDETLRTYQNLEGLVDYQRLKNDLSKQDHPFRKALEEMASLKTSEYEAFNANQQKAFLINAYNAFTVKLILDHYPVESIKDCGSLVTSPWSIEFFSMLDGKIKSIDPIEHEWLRPKFKDYRIHAAVNCASISCPSLRRGAFVAATLDADLDEQMRHWLANKQQNEFHGAKWRISKIFDWYEDDFKSWGGSVEQVIRKYGPKEIQKVKGKIDLDYLDYNWQLNAVNAKK